MKALWLTLLLFLMVLVVALTPMVVSAQEAAPNEGGGSPALGGVAQIIVETVLVVLFAMFKPLSWPRKLKQMISMILAAAAGLITAYITWGPKYEWQSLLNMAAVGVAYSQIAYVFVGERLGLDNAARALRVKLLPFTAPPQVPVTPRM